MKKRKIPRVGFALALLFLLLEMGLASPSTATTQPIVPFRDSTLRKLWAESCEHLADTALGHRVQALIAERIRSAGELFVELPPLRGMKDLMAKDGRLRVISWQHTMPMARALYIAVVAYLDNENRLRVAELRDRVLPVGEGAIDEQWLRWQLPETEWIGAGYYAAQPFAWQGKPCYLLLGLAGSTLFVQRRIIETMYIGEDNLLHFGVPSIVYGRERLCRLMYSCSARVSMTVHFYDRGRRVLIDHLSPPSPQYTGMAQYYGPDFSQDELGLSRHGEWVFHSDVVVAAPKER